MDFRYGIVAQYLLLHIGVINMACSRPRNRIRCGVCVDFAKPACVLFVSSTSDILFNQSSGTITDHSQLAKDIDSYFKSQVKVEDSDHRRRCSFYQTG